MRLDRIERQEAVTVDIIDCAAKPELNNTSMTCCTLDVSEVGMQILAEMPLPVATRLGLRLDLQTALYRLEAEVRWQLSETDHRAGVLLDDDSPDFVPWTQMFHLDF